MRAFKLSRKSHDWVVISIWNCKYEVGRTLCVCCQPKHVVPPQVLKNPNKEIRDYFRMNDSNGKSMTPSQSRYPDRLNEAKNCKS